MKTNLIFVSAVLLAYGTCAQAAGKAHGERAHNEPAPPPDTYDGLIAKQAKYHDVPEALIHRVVMRESRYHPDAMHKRYYGLMQITYQTARSMGYKGEPKGLLDAETNLTYGVPYLANAFIVADKKEDRAVALYSKGYYFEAKRKHRLALMRTADSPSLEPPPKPVAQAPEPPPNPVVQIFHALAGNREPVPPAFPTDAASTSPAAR
ncbi:lytic transglycosylase domain-containing protein [Methyloferula stellata]|jgi:soluble lytic murein transglycosylase-like protein|uniref:lytic transglycosylase domain-containing protein n=1 Tax=Methyloferula stellata TaxID=876270 RepID=UPI000A02F749|nr:lytic transglycosylase domain-containing protein [Methyloferula stellata]